MLDAQFLSDILANAPVFLLIAVRALAMIETAPLLSSDGIPQAAKLALAGFAAFSAFPTALAAGWDLVALGGPFNAAFLFLLIGEAILGIIMGFYITLIFSAFSTAGQFFSLQMGFGASETFDPLAQIENPLMGQYLNLVAMLVFLSLGGFSELFLGGFWRSIQSISAYDLVTGREAVVGVLIRAFPRSFWTPSSSVCPSWGPSFSPPWPRGLFPRRPRR